MFFYSNAKTDLEQILCDFKDSFLGSSTRTHLNYIKENLDNRDMIKEENIKYFLSTKKIDIS